MKSLAVYILGTLALGISLAHAAFVPNVYDTNTDAVAQLFIRAQIGVQVGPSGSNFVTSQQLAGSNYVNFAVRPLLTNNLTFFVTTNGNDSNPGTNPAAPLLTPQVAVNKALTYDFGTNNVIIQLSNGVYAGSILVQQQMGNTDWKDTQGMLILQGNNASPTSVVLTNASTNHLVLASRGARVSVRSMALGTTNIPGADLIDVQQFSTLNISNLVFGPCGANACQLVSETSAMMWASGPYTITGGGLAHYLAHSGGAFFLGQAVTITGTPAYTLAFAQAYSGGCIMVVSGISYTGSTTGPKYQVMRGGSFTSFGGSSADALFPGSVAGIQDLQMAEGSSQPFTATNGVYGATNASSAGAGVIGEYTNTIVPFASRVFPTSNTLQTVISFTVTPGDWDFQASVIVTDAGSTIIDSPVVSIVPQVSNTLGADGTAVYSGNLTAGNDAMTVPRFRVNTPTNCTVFLVGRLRFTGGAPGFYGQMSARRVR